MFPFHTIFNIFLKVLSMHRASDSIAAADNVLVFFFCRGQKVSIATNSRKCRTV